MNNKKQQTVPIPSKDQICKFLELDEDVENIDLITQIIQTSMKLAGDGIERGELKIINSAIKEKRFSFKTFAKYREIPKISIFGSARTSENDPCYIQAKKFARSIANAGFMVITGAASGIMKAGHEGAGKKMSFGVNIRLPFEQKANWIIKNDPKLITYRYFFIRKLFFLKESHAIVLFPGGFGTLDEGFEALTLIQTGKAQLFPIIMLAPPGNPYWKDWLTFTKKRILKSKMITKDDLSLFKITDSIIDAKNEIIKFYRVYHSYRFVAARLVIRIKHKIHPAFIEKLNEEFSDIIDSGWIQQGKAMREEANEKDIWHLPRLTFHFDKRSYGRLRQLIDKINTAKTTKSR